MKASFNPSLISPNFNTHPLIIFSHVSFTISSLSLFKVKSYTFQKITPQSRILILHTIRVISYLTPKTVFATFYSFQMHYAKPKIYHHYMIMHFEDFQTNNHTYHISPTINIIIKITPFKLKKNML